MFMTTSASIKYSSAAPRSAPNGSYALAFDYHYPEKPRESEITPTPQTQPHQFEMPSTWRHLSTGRSHISTLKGYLAGHESAAASRTPRTPGNQEGADKPQSWRAWAGQKIRVRKRGMYGTGKLNTEVVNLFPGWAVKKYPTSSARASHTSEELRPFDLEVFVSGFAISYKPPENASRSQRAFLRLAKGYAYLPKLVEDAVDVRPNTSSLARLSPSTEELLASVTLPPRPTEITDDFDMEKLEYQLRRAKKIIGDEGSSTSTSPSSSTESLSKFGASARAPAPPPSANGVMSNDIIKRLHANLEKRIQPFWSSVLPNRTIRLHLFASHHLADEGHTPGRNSARDAEEDELSLNSHDGPLVYQDITTAADGSFQVKFNIQWEDLCQHPAALQIVFGEAVKEHDLLVVAQLLPLDPPSAASFRAPSISPSPSSSPLSALTRVPITHSPIRVISDVDDTIKLSGILQGARAVFHNVFVKDLTENVIPGMGDWYASMWQKGVRFHYVSNGPFEYLPVLNEFFEISKLPPGSIKLRSYAGRSLFSGLLSAPAARKRAGVVDVLDAFPNSRFFLIGDTGEQDLELYADLARERPDRILAVFVRDADSTTEPLEDPTGWSAIGAAGTRVNDRPLVPRSESGISSQSPSSSSSIDSISKYNYSSFGSPLNPANADTNRTPRASARSRTAGKPLPTTYFNNNVLIREPESFGEMPTPTIKTFAQMELSNGQQHDGALHPPRINSSGSSTKFTSQPPQPIEPPSIHNNSFNNPRSSAMSSRSQQSTSSTSSADSYGKQPLSEADKRRRDLQLRVYRARTQMPGHVLLRVFRDPKECVEAQRILDREGS